MTEIPDFGRSFIVCTGAGNAPQFWIESICHITEHPTATTQSFFQCASCKSEHTYGDADLFITPNYDFMPIFGANETLIFRRLAYITPGKQTYKSIGKSPWGPAKTKIRMAPGRELTSGSEICAAAQAALPLVGRVTCHDAEHKRSMTLEFPIKTMNTDTANARWQVDTGPLVVPDLATPPKQCMASMQLAYVAFKEMTFADFVFETETPVMMDGKEVARVHHYTETKRLTTQNQVFAMVLA